MSVTTVKDVWSHGHKCFLTFNHEVIYEKLRYQQQQSQGNSEKVY